MGGIYGHVTPETKKRILDVLQARWESSLLALRSQEQERLIALLPQMAETINRLKAVQQATADQGGEDPRPFDAQTRLRPRPSGGGTGPLTCAFAWWAILGLNQ